MRPHQDIGLLTVVVSPTWGLLVRDAQTPQWHAALPAAGDTLVMTIMVGATLDYITAHAFPKVPARRRRRGRERYALVFQLRADYRATIDTTQLTTARTGPFKLPRCGDRRAVRRAHLRPCTDRQRHRSNRSTSRLFASLSMPFGRCVTMVPGGTTMTSPQMRISDAPPNAAMLRWVGLTPTIHSPLANITIRGIWVSAVCASSMKTGCSPATASGVPGYRQTGQIPTYVIARSLAHQDSMGNSAMIRPGEIQRMRLAPGCCTVR